MKATVQITLEDVAAIDNQKLPVSVIRKTGIEHTGSREEVMDMVKLLVTQSFINQVKTAFVEIVKEEGRVVTEYKEAKAKKEAEEAKKKAEEEAAALKAKTEAENKAKEIVEKKEAGKERK